MGLWLRLDLSRDGLGLSNKRGLSSWGLTGMLGRRTDGWNWADGGSARGVRLQRLDLCLEWSGGLDEIWLSDPPDSQEPRMQLGASRVTALCLVGVHNAGQLVGYYGWRGADDSLWCCWREGKRHPRFLDGAPADDLLGRNVAQRSGLGHPLRGALDGLRTGEILAGWLVGLQLRLCGHVGTFGGLGRRRMSDLLFIILRARPPAFAERLRVSV